MKRLISLLSYRGVGPRHCVGYGGPRPRPARDHTGRLGARWPGALAQMPSPRERVAFMAPIRAVLVVLFLAMTQTAAADAIGLPEEDLFAPLLADPKEPRFFISVLNVESAQRNTTVGAVAYGENFGLVRWPGESQGEGWQLNLAGGVFAQFDLEAPSMDLVNADYTIGFPLTYRRGAFSARLRWYHQSSHLGDEFLLREQPQRVNLSYEAIELLAAHDIGAWRVYGGGEYLYAREPDELEPGVLHAGAEYRHPRHAFRVAQVGVARFVAALDAKRLEQHDWDNAMSLKAGLEFRSVRDSGQAGRHWSLLAEYYDGPSPYGQFLTEEITYWGLSLSLSL